MPDNFDDDLTIDGSSLLEAIRGSTSAGEDSKARWQPQPPECQAVTVLRGRDRLGGLALSLLFVAGAVGALIGFYSLTVLLNDAGDDVPAGASAATVEAPHD